jgi:hypothetical protein
VSKSGANGIIIILPLSNHDDGMDKLASLPKGVLVEWGRPRDTRGWERDRKKIALRRGVLEVRTSETVLPANVGSWRLPVIGEVFIRILKKDGSPGMAVESYRPNPAGVNAWLPEGQTPEDAATVAA